MSDIIAYVVSLVALVVMLFIGFWLLFDLSTALVYFWIVVASAVIIGFYWWIYRVVLWLISPRK